MKKKVVIIIGIIAAILAIVIAVFIGRDKDNEIPVPTYKVTFETYGGTKISEQTVKEGEQVTKPEDPTKEGFIFIKWVYEGETYDFSLAVTSDINLAAEWIEEDKEVEKFVVKFNSDGGTTVANQVVEKGSKVIKPTAPEKQGYKFLGWTLNNVTYNFDSKVESDIELFAKWEKLKEATNDDNKNNNNNNNSNTATPKKTFTVKFNTDGGSNIKDQIITEGNKVAKPADPTKTGYTFVGWTLEENDYNFNNLVTKNITLIAKWKKNTYTVTFNTDGGSVVASQTIEYGNKVSKPSNPTKTGYIFEEWTLNGLIYNFDSEVTKNITLVASWISNEWEFDKTSGAIIKYKGTDADVVIPEKINGVKVTTIRANAFTNSNMTSLKFSSGITKVENGAILKTYNSRLNIVYMTNSQYSSAGDWLRVFGMTGSCINKKTDSGVFIRTRLTKDGCALCGGSCSTSNVMYIENIEGSVYSISYSTLNCGIIYEGPSLYLSTENFTIPNLNLTGYTFNGWTGANGNTPQKNVVIPAGSTGTKSFVANCTEHTYTIKLDYDNYLGYSGTVDFSEVDYNEKPYCGSSTKFCTYKYSEKVTIPYNKAKRSGYKFEGWATSTNGVVKYEEGEQVSKLVSQNNGVITLYARWEKE